jgi:S-sulfo-L-cysteine synthase (O-acetyl-L-serine-dependent)
MAIVELSQALIHETTNTLDMAVGNTPLLPLQRLGAGLSPQVKIVVKAEWFNPGGSVKDRPALSILRTAINEGQLYNGKTLLDSTSGNMGISYATLGAAMGIKVKLTIPASASPERLKILRMLGAELVLTDPLEGSDGAINAARQLFSGGPDRYFYANQYNNPANWHAHYTSTGPEIVNQTAGQVTHFVAGLGTSGTLMGAGRYLRQYNPEIKIIAVQPDSAFNGLEGLKHMPTAIQPGIYDPNFADDLIEVSTEESYEMVLRLAREEGLFVGVSSGAAAIAALKLAAGLERGMVVAVFPDAGYKYLSESFWEKVG